MTDFSNDFGVMLGRILERSEQTVASLGHINTRMDKADEWRGKASEQLGQLPIIHHRLKTLERNHSRQKQPPRMERWSKNMLAGGIPIILVWATQPTERALEVLKAAAELMRAFKGGG